VLLPPRVGELVSDLPELTETGRRSRVTVIGLIDTRMARSIKGAEQSITAEPAPPFAAGGWAARPASPCSGWTGCPWTTPMNRWSWR
jgi:hypothetical protein